MTEDVGAGQHDDPQPGADVTRVGAEHARASAGDAARTLAAGHHLGMLATITGRPPGSPFGSLVTFALDAHGDPLLVISTMAEHTRNAIADPRASLLVVELPGADEDPLDAGRVTLVGELRQVGDDEQARATSIVVEAVPTVGRYAHFGDFSCWRLGVTAVRWVGGFGAMSWIDAAAYRAATADPVLAHRRPILEHMNTDHADACLAIVASALARRDLTGAEMIGADRFGCDYRAMSVGGPAIVVRVPFPQAATDVGDVRRLLVDQAHEAREARQSPLDVSAH